MENENIIEEMKKSVRWKMDWRSMKAQHPDNERIQSKPDIEDMFEEEEALAVLLFTKTVFLPAFIAVYKEFGVKPLIVALEPTEIETDIFWMSHPYPHKRLLTKNKNKSNIYRRSSTVTTCS